MDGSSINIVPILSQTVLKTVMGKLIFQITIICLLSLILETAMGVKLNLQNQEDKDFLKATIGISKCIFYRLMRPWLYSPTLYYYFNSSGREEKIYLNTLHDFCRKVINERRNQVIKEGGYKYSTKKKHAMLDILLKAHLHGGSIDEQGIEDEVNTFMFEASNLKSFKKTEQVCDFRKTKWKALVSSA